MINCFFNFCTNKIEVDMYVYDLFQKFTKLGNTKILVILKLGSGEPMPICIFLQYCRINVPVVS